MDPLHPPCSSTLFLRPWRKGATLIEALLLWILPCSRQGGRQGARRVLSYAADERGRWERAHISSWLGSMQRIGSAHRVLASPLENQPQCHPSKCRVLYGGIPSRQTRSPCNRAPDLSLRPPADSGGWGDRLCAAPSISQKTLDVPSRRAKLLETSPCDPACPLLAWVKAPSQRGPSPEPPAGNTPLAPQLARPKTVSASTRRKF